MGGRDTLPRDFTSGWPIRTAERATARIDERNGRERRAGPKAWQSLTDDELLTVVLDLIDRDPVHPGLTELFAAIRADAFCASPDAVSHRRFAR